MKMRFLFLVGSIAVVALWTGCNPSSGSGSQDQQAKNETKRKYYLAIKSGEGPLFSEQFNRLFPGASNGISDRQGRKGPTGEKMWQSAAGLYGRYLFFMDCGVEFDSAGTRIISLKEPNFSLIEVKSIDLHPDGSESPQFDMVTNFNADAWQRLVDAKGDFRVLGVTLETNKPLKEHILSWAWRGVDVEVDR